MKKKKFGPPEPPKRADLGWTKAEMGCFSQKGLCYSFEILQGLQGNKNIRIPMRERPPTHSKIQFLANKRGNGLS